MNNSHPPESDRQLHDLLQEWKPHPALPPRFQERVWQQIQRTEAQKPQSSLLALLQWIDAAFRRPALVAAYVAVLLFIGLGAGYRQAQGKSAAANTKWRALYVQSVDPYQGRRN